MLFRRESEAPGDLLLGLAPHPLGLLVGLPDERRAGTLPFGEAPGSHVGKVAVQPRHPLVDLRFQARRFLALLARLDDALLDGLLPAGKGLRERPRDEVDENSEEGDEVSELPDPHRQPEKALAPLGRRDERERREKPKAHAASLRPSTFSTSVRARVSVLLGSSAAERAVSVAISLAASSSSVPATVRACASFFSRRARPSARIVSRSFRASRRARASSCSI